MLEQHDTRDENVGTRAETQTEFRARMRATYGDGRNGTVHWRDNPAAQAEIQARKAQKDADWNGQLAKWKGERALKKMARDAEQKAKVELAKQAGSIEEALRVLGITQ